MPVQRRQRTGDFTTNVQIARLSLFSLIVGAVCALIAIILLKMIGLITNLSFYHRWSLAFTKPTGNHLGPWVIIVPIVGALLVGLIARYGSEKVRGHGIPEAIEAMLINESKVQARVAFWKPISAAISIGTGGPFGAEGPIIMTGGSFGSLLSQFFRFSSIERRILLVAGAAGGMSATFAAPISSVMFAVELLVFEFKPRSLVPIALASAVADVIRVAMIGPGPLFGMPALHHVSMMMILVSAGLGLVGSVLAVLLTWAIYGVEDAFRKLPVHWMWWPAIGAVVIGIGGWIAPRALGVGYDSISAMLNLKLTVSVLIGLLIVKTIIWVVALGSGTSGGILAPILIIGGSFGGVLGVVFHAPHPEMWALLGMSAIFAGVTRTPFTSILFPLELTHNLGALLPLLITSCVATGVSALILPRSILTEKIARRGLHLTREYTTDPLQMHYVREFATQERHAVSADDAVGVVAGNLAESKLSDWLEVRSAAGDWVGLVPLSRLVHAATRDAQVPVAACMDDPDSVATVMETETVKVALDAMLNTDSAWVKVVSNDDGHMVGAITSEQLMDVRRRVLRGENERQQVMRLFGRKKPKPAEVSETQKTVNM